MLATTPKQWFYCLTRQYSLPISPWTIDALNPYVMSINTFHCFTGRIIAALRRNDARVWALVKNGKLGDIYDCLSYSKTLIEYLQYRDWVKDATLKHPLRRTTKQQHWLLLIEWQESVPTCDLEAILEQTAFYLLAWEEQAYSVSSLMIDWPVQYFFRSKNAIKEAEANNTDFGKSCWVCANDFDSQVHLRQQGPCGHYQCWHCFQKALEHVAAQYLCAFCRACLICGTKNCKYHVIPREDAPPYPLDVLLRRQRYVFLAGRCTALDELSGFSPKRYWALREQSRKYRVRLTKITWYLKQDLVPEHCAQVRKELERIHGVLIRAQVEQARVLQMEDEENEQQGTPRDVGPWLWTA